MTKPRRTALDEARMSCPRCPHCAPTARSDEPTPAQQKKFWNQIEALHASAEPKRRR
jgi:hypothetical protein